LNAAWTEKNWTEKNWTEKNWTEKNWTEKNWTEKNWTEKNWIERNVSDGRYREIRLLRLQVVAFSSDGRRRTRLGTGGRILPALPAQPPRERRRRLADYIWQ
jgi:hypothetical protein